MTSGDVTVAFTPRREETCRSAASAPPNLLLFLFKDRTGEKRDAMATTPDYYHPRGYCLMLPDEKLLLLSFCISDFLPRRCTSAEEVQEVPGEPSPL